MTVKTEKELADAIKNGIDSIEIEGDLTNKVLKIKATGNISWVIALGAIGVAVTAILTLPIATTPLAPISAAENFIAISSAPIAIGILGYSTTISAITIAVTAGSISILNKLRKYKIIKKEKNKLILVKK